MKEQEIKWVGFWGARPSGVPNPATADALAMGCTCSAKVNKRGQGYMDGLDGPFFAHYLNCPVHGQDARMALAKQFDLRPVS